MAKTTKLTDSTIAKMLLSIGEAYAVAVLLLFGLAVAQYIQPNVYYAFLFASFAVLMGLVYAIYRISKRPRFMFSLS